MEKRYKEIQEMAKAYASHMTSDKDMQVAFADALRRGAEWADEHPKPVRVTFKEFEDAAKEVIDKDWQARQDRLWNMIERNLRAQFIRKACEWLDCYIDNYLFIDAENKAGIKWDDFINNFRKAMKGE